MTKELLSLSQSPEKELYPKKQFQEMTEDILSGRWKEMKDIYWPGGHGEDYISERAENGHIVLRNILLKYDEKNKKAINEIVQVSETIFDQKKPGENKTAGYLMRNKNGEKFWESRNEFDEYGNFKKQVIKDGQENILKIEEKENNERSNIIYYDEGGKEGLRIALSHQPGSNYETRTYKDANSGILETQQWETLPSKHMTRRLDKNDRPIKLEYSEEYYKTKDYANPYHLKGYGEEAAAGYEKRMHEIWQRATESNF